MTLKKTLSIGFNCINEVTKTARSKRQATPHPLQLCSDPIAKVTSYKKALLALTKHSYLWMTDNVTDRMPINPHYFVENMAIFIFSVTGRPQFTAY